MGFLRQAAESWLEISKSSYTVVYGKNQKLHTVEIVFDSLDFYHLAGFQYLDDIQIPLFSQSKTLEAVLDGKIDDEYISRGKKYLPLVEPRLIALINLEHSLDNEFRMFRYNPYVYPFYTMIKTAEYLIEGKISSDLLFFFTIKAEQAYKGMSIFMKTNDRNYSMNHKPLSILKKEKIDLKTSERLVLIDKLSNQKPLIKTNDTYLT